MTPHTPAFTSMEALRHLACSYHQSCNGTQQAPITLSTYQQDVHPSIH